MTHKSAVVRTQLFTAFGTVVFLDQASRSLRHGDADISPANVFYIKEEEGHAGPLIFDPEGVSEVIVCSDNGCRPISAGSNGDGARLLTWIPLERGLIGLSARGLFLSAIPNGNVTLSGAKCSTWELFSPGYELE